MHISIRKFLLINLLLAVIVTASVSIVGNYYLDERDIQKHLDALLLQSALMFQSMLGDDINERNLMRMQIDLKNMPMRVQQLFDNSKYYFHRKHYNDSFQFVLWDKNGKQLLRSSSAPPIQSFSDIKLGFSDFENQSAQWRLYTLKDPALNATLMLAERYDMRNELVRRIAMDDLYIMLWTYPVSGLLIWMIIGRGMEVLRRVADEVGTREPSNLHPVNVEHVPSEIKPIIDELNKLFLRLQEAIDREKRFAADAAHELRTPLAALRAQAQVAMNVKSDAERLETLQNVIACVDRSTHVVQQLLTLSRLVPEATTINDASSVNLTVLATDLIMQLAPIALQKNIEMELIADDKKMFFVQGNVTALSILLRNLIDNAIRYTQEGGFIQVGVRQDGSDVILSVSDNGPGIPTELRSRVFERFFRVLGNRSPGSGLGLSIVEQIAQLHGAKVSLNTPALGVGLAVEIRFSPMK